MTLSTQLLWFLAVATGYVGIGFAWAHYKNRTAGRRGSDIRESGSEDQESPRDDVE